MKISCVIPATNEEANIQRCVERAWRAGMDEVIVADGGSSDGTCEAASASDCILVHSPPGRARQQNEGVQRSSGDVVYFQHADNWLEEGGGQQIRDAFERHPNRTCGAFRQRIDADGLKYRLLEWGNSARVTWLGSPYGDQGIFVRREAFDRAGGFPTVRILEELLLMRELRRESWPLLLNGPLVIDARRWEENGVIRQTLRNWKILTLHALGRKPEQLETLYPRHDSAGESDQ